MKVIFYFIIPLLYYDFIKNIVQTMGFRRNTAVKDL